MWMLMKLRKWDSFESRGFTPWPFSVSGGEGCIGFVPVYETQEAAAAAGDPGDKIMEVKASGESEASE